MTELINETHENERYLPHVDLPENLIAVPNLVDVVKVRLSPANRRCLLTNPSRMPPSSSSSSLISSSVRYVLVAPQNAPI